MAKPKTEIIINDQWKIVRQDALNWQVYELREIKESHKTTQAVSAIETSNLKLANDICKALKNASVY